MHIICPGCRHVLSFTDRRPAFCSQCGERLRASDGPEATVAEPAALDPAATQVEPAAGPEGPPPDRIGGYRLLRALGSGGMGTVYEAEDVASGRRVAVKLIAPGVAASADAVERFRREGRLASTLVHPRCVFVLAADEEAGRPYLVMELMPGRTLEDLVAEQGPLPPAAAVEHILDVIDGLEEAHRLGFIHRDVKPSNCFLDADGRVKVGDFGLAKSLGRADNLTRTGSFLGTVLYAAPEQIKGEPVDAQTDVYAVAATLYFLLTGHAPFEGTDAAATLARTVSEPAAPPRALRPELDAALDAVVLRGLERERARRWRSLADLRTALLPFRPGPLPFAALGLRFGAYLLDGLVLLLINAALALAQGGTVYRPPFVGLLYFALLEGLWGATLGKWLVGLRVRRVHPPGARAGLPRAVLRATAFCGLIELGTWTRVLAHALAPISDLSDWEEMVLQHFLYNSVLPLAGLAVGVATLLAPMRQRNGYRGLHEWLSGTRVVPLPGPSRRPLLRGRPREQALLRPEGMPESLGPFAIRGALRWDDGGRVLLGQDRALGRPVWLWLRPHTAAPLPARRREVSRATRLRWLGCGRHADQQWDAFMAVRGAPLADCVRPGGEPWPAVLPLLEQLADELAAADAESTLPDTLHADQVWVSLDGQAQLVDLPLQEGGRPAVGQHRPLALLAEVAVLALEGRPRGPEARGPIRAPLPLPAHRLLGRLLGDDEPLRDPAALQAGLEGLADRPAEVSRGRRLAHLGVLAVLLSVAFSWMLLAGSFNQLVSFAALQESIQENQRCLRDLEEGALRDAAVAAINPDPLPRLHGAAQLEADYRLRDRLADNLERDRRHLAGAAGMGTGDRALAAGARAGVALLAAVGAGPGAAAGAGLGELVHRRTAAAGLRRPCPEPAVSGPAGPPGGHLPGAALIHLQRIEHQPGEELWIEIRRFRRHLLQVAGDLLDVLHARRRHEDGQLAVAGEGGGVDLAQQVDVAAVRAGTEGLGEQVVEDEHVQDADGQAAPGRAVRRRQPRHHVRGAEAGRLPDAVGHGAEAEQLLGAVRLDQLPGVARPLLPLADALDLEVAVEQHGQAVGAQLAQAGDEAVRRQDDQARVTHAHEHHEDEVGRRLVVAHLTGRPPLLQVAQAGLVAVMAVGDEDGPGAEQASDGADGVLVADGPQAADDAEVVGRLQGQGPLGHGVEVLHDLVLGVGVKAEDGAEVHGGGVGEAEAVGLGAGQGLLVRVDAALAEGLEAHARHEAAAGVALALDLEVLVVGVQGAGRVLDDDVLALPVAQEGGGAGVAIAGLVVAGLFLVEVEADDVVGAALVEGVLQRRVDDVVGWSDDVAEGADAAQVIAERPESTDLGHRILPRSRQRAADSG
jgi:uncharacterized RDD family membrane protein YckC